ncbi:MAG: DUF2330 domain-containing protein [Deltaproteobacteria bacterium]|nr:DUF2330 domain-containing protein [Deltaproteobacteria bacterium]
MSNDHPSWMRSGILGALVSASLLGWFSTPAEACGGLFCNGQNPVVQTGEQIVFSVDPAEGKVEAIINIRYQGSPREFAWILPLQSAPTKVEVAPSTVFSATNNLTAPRFVVTTEEEGLCESGGLRFASASEANFAPEAPKNAGVTVLEQRAIGPYESSVIRSDDPEATRTWLVDNGYAVTDDMMKSVVPYVHKGDVLLALRLQNDQDVGDIQPVWVAMDAADACVPIRLTAIAAVSDMDVTALVLSDAGRAIPKNYFHVELNLARIDWTGGGGNYRDVVSKAADEGQGNAFVTEFAGSARIFDRQIYTPGSYDQQRLLSVTDARSFVEEVARQGLIVKQEAAAIVARQLPDEAFEQGGLSRAQFLNCAQCWTFSIAPVPFDPSVAVTELWTRLVEPEMRAQSLFDRHRYATRLFTMLSPEEMTIDPEFSFRSDLPDISNVHNATAYLECGLGRSRSEAPVRLEIEETGQVIYFESNSGNGVDRTQLDAMPAAAKIEQLEERSLISDRSADIERLLDAHNGLNGKGCGCSATQSDGSGWWALALMAFVFRRRRV